MDPLLATLLCASLALTFASVWQSGPPALGGAGFGLKPAPDGRILVDTLAPGGPADLAGLRPGDWLVAVNGIPVASLPGPQLVDAIRGPVGSQLLLVYVRGNAHPRQVVMTRAALGTPPGTQPPEAPPMAPRPLPFHPAPPQTPLPFHPEPPSARTTPGGVRLLPRTLEDPAAGGRTALRFLVPEGWQAQGHIAWLHEFSVLTNLRLRMNDPRSGVTLEWLPTMHFAFTDQLPGLMLPGQNWMGALFAPPESDPARFVESFWAPQALPHLRGRRPVARQDFPRRAQLAVASDAGWQAQAVRLRYTYDQHGEVWEEDVSFTLAHAPMAGGMAMWNVQSAASCRAPRGELDRHAALIEAVLQNTHFTPEWLAALTVVRQLFRQGLAQQMADTAAFGRALQQHNAHIQQLGQQLHEERMRSFDRIAESQREYLAGVETFTNPYNQHGMYLPAGYAEQWMNPQGEVVLSATPGFDPNAGDTTHWRKLERRDPMRS
ncbi:PDZ domain-containing protein [Myxococcus sp. K15C18031901]|uniref:PDZ domain-containing protein n=1 Tax=Myxococcus dinghuensis TaxID=2906761 RepID=UPI0020A7A3CC|nr:PDZ domain-containing protein [Myxococcus dinghuensis]MCP3102086.1 PDZ domain-containing protein [Myxococcus dinghuensis]